MDNPETVAKLIPLAHIYIYDRSLSWLGTDTSIKCGGVKQDFLD